MTDEADPKGLIRESYRIEGISTGECRSIFVDWALSLGPAMTPPAAIALLIARYAAANPGHPMNAVLSDGLEAPPEARRRGGRAARVAG
ncbi:hypothetical protein [Szabonella alba]|uniref:Uncharacterized protein n=1 Tax=Szabonella alba TaxID=2804194 RepID=A0A8K0Y189_9RHOB|nr:hypothetical protein [Szabonella alba]MBL4917898.1 hypothetical protein [Szabonella alba]